MNPNGVIPHFRPAESSGPHQVLQGGIVVLACEVPGIVTQDPATERLRMAEEVAEVFPDRCVQLAFGGHPLRPCPSRQDQQGSSVVLRISESTSSLRPSSKLIQVEGSPPGTSWFQ